MSKIITFTLKITEETDMVMETFEECETDDLGNLLFQAIDFFTQSLHLEQLSFYGYEMVHEMLGLKSSALFIREGGVYRLRYQKGYSLSEYDIVDTDRLKTVATLFGRIMTTEQNDYFVPEHLEKFQVKLVIPLIVKDQMVGFVLSDGLKSGEMTDKLLPFAFAVMQLMNRAYENALNFQELEAKNYELDKKIFNLFFINHCSRTLLSELNLDRIYGICIDILRELTASSVTSFGVYDETRDRIVLKGYQDILTFGSLYTELELCSEYHNPSKIVYHLEHDRAELDRIFVNCEEFVRLKAEYIVLLVKDRILGFVTLGKPVSERVYDRTLFELIETIATSIYISIVNAQQFKQITVQNEIIHAKFETLQQMNRIIQNINSCESLDQLCEIALQSLEIGYGVGKGFLCLYDEDDTLRVMGDIHIPHLKGQVLREGSALEELKDKGVYYDFSISGLNGFFPEFESERHVDANCLVIAPIRIDRMALGDRGTLGYLVVFETSDVLREEEVLLIDTLANSVAPIVFQMNENERIQKLHTVNQEATLVEMIKEKLQNRLEYFIDFQIWYKHMPIMPFEERNLKGFEEYPCFLVEQYLFCPVEDEMEPESEKFDGSLIIENLEDFFLQVKVL